jgi:hypothetical protein
MLPRGSHRLDLQLRRRWSDLDPNLGRRNCWAAARTAADTAVARTVAAADTAVARTVAAADIRRRRLRNVLWLIRRRLSRSTCGQHHHHPERSRKRTEEANHERVLSYYLYPNPPQSPLTKQRPRHDKPVDRDAATPLPCFWTSCGKQLTTKQLDAYAAVVFQREEGMRLYSGKIPTIAQDLIRKLKEEGDIEVSDVPEAQLDVEAVLKEYLRLDRELTEKAKDHMEKRRLPYEQLLKIKRSMAEERDIGIGDESVSYIANQILEAFMHSRFIDEVFGDDGDMRKKIQVILRKHMQVDTDIDHEVRRRIKNLQEGTATWEIEYQKVMDQLRRQHKLE